MFFQENAVQIAVIRAGGPTRVSNLLSCSNAVVHRWVANQRVPNYERARILAELAGMPVERLRPI